MFLNSSDPSECYFNRLPAPITWCITSGGAGHEAQCLGVCDALHITPVIKRVNPKGVYKLLAPIGPAMANQTIMPPWPDLLIVSGRQSLPYARGIKRHSKGKTFVAVLQKPGLPSSWFDFIWVPACDHLIGDNVFTTLMAPHRLSEGKLLEAQRQFQSLISTLPKPIVTVLIGGPSRSFDFGLKEASQLARDLVQLHQATGCSFLISYSYRTPSPFKQIFSQALFSLPVHIWDGEMPNPYLGYLSLANYFIVTSDSINMLGEAAYTGKPIYAYPIPFRHKKFKQYYAQLIQLDVIRWYDGSLNYWSYSALDATKKIAQALYIRLAAHQQAREIF